MIIRPAETRDATEMAAILNAIITAGGTTAYEDPFTPESLAENYIAAPLLIACHVADENGVLGFQAIWRPLPQDTIGDGWAVIATFAKPGMTQKGIGSALFAATCKAARDAGIRSIDAMIRADNSGGLAYYTRQGFSDYDVVRAVPLKNGTPVDRIRKRFDL